MCATLVIYFETCKNENRGLIGNNYQSALLSTMRHAPVCIRVQRYKHTFLGLAANHISRSVELEGWWLPLLVDEEDVRSYTRYMRKT